MMNIKLNEIRVGNLVKVDNPKFHPGADVCYRVIKTELRHEQGRDMEIVGLFATTDPKDLWEIEFSQSIEFLKPIELTQEILEQCGFHWCIRDLFYRNGNFVLLLNDHSYEVGIFVNTSSGYQFVNLGIHIKYLHQLQNIYFALTANEIKIKEQ